MRDSKSVIYFAAGMFNQAQKQLSVRLTEVFEKEQLVVFNPIRDGFELAKLEQALLKKIPQNELQKTAQTIIYVLDIMKIIESDIVFACMDDQMDEGVIVEITIAKIIGKPVIAYRSDIRAPYGNTSDQLAGAHFFPMFQVDHLIQDAQVVKTVAEADSTLHLVGKRVKNIMRERGKSEILDERDAPVHIREILCLSKLLFGGCGDDIHSDTALKQITAAYLKNQAIFNAFRLLNKVIIVCV